MECLNFSSSWFWFPLVILSKSYLSCVVFDMFDEPNAPLAIIIVIQKRKKKDGVNICSSFNIFIILFFFNNCQAKFSKVPQASVTRKRPRFMPNPEKYWGPGTKAGRHPKTFQMNNRNWQDLRPRRWTRVFWSQASYRLLAGNPLIELWGINCGYWIFFFAWSGFPSKCFLSWSSITMICTRNRARIHVCRCEKDTSLSECYTLSITEISKSEAQFMIRSVMTRCRVNRRSFKLAMCWQLILAKFEVIVVCHLVAIFFCAYLVRWNPTKLMYFLLAFLI